MRVSNKRKEVVTNTSDLAVQATTPGAIGDVGQHLADAVHDLASAGHHLADAGLGLESIATGVDVLQGAVRGALAAADVIGKRGHVSKLKAAAVLLHSKRTATEMVEGAIDGATAAADHAASERSPN